MNALNPQQLATARQQYLQAVCLIAQNPAAFQSLPVVMRKTLIRQGQKLQAPEAVATLQALSDAPQYDPEGYVIAEGNLIRLFQHVMTHAYKPEATRRVAVKPRRLGWFNRSFAKPSAA